MPTPGTSKLPKPKSEDEFEDIVLDALKLRWADPNASRNGRRGQRQNGVDIIGKSNRIDGGIIGAQCKNTEFTTFREIQEEVIKAESFKPVLAEFLFVTAANRDSRLQEKVRLHFESNPAPFPVVLVFWEDLIHLISGDPQLVSKHWPYGSIRHARVCQSPRVTAFSFATPLQYDSDSDLTLREIHLLLAYAAVDTVETSGRSTFSYIWNLEPSTGRDRIPKWSLICHFSSFIDAFSDLYFALTDGRWLTRTSRYLDDLKVRYSFSRQQGKTAYRLAILSPSVISIEAVSSPFVVATPLSTSRLLEAVAIGSQPGGVILWGDVHRLTDPSLNHFQKFLDSSKRGLVSLSSVELDHRNPECWRMLP